MKSRMAPVSPREGSIASLMHYAISELGSASSASVVPLSDVPGAIRCSGSACAINGATLLVWYAPMMPDPFRPRSLRILMAAT